MEKEEEYSLNTGISGSIKSVFSKFSKKQQPNNNNINHGFSNSINNITNENHNPAMIKNNSTYFTRNTRININNKTINNNNNTINSNINKQIHGAQYPPLWEAPPGLSMPPPAPTQQNSQHTTFTNENMQMDTESPKNNKESINNFNIHNNVQFEENVETMDRIKDPIVPGPRNATNNARADKFREMMTSDTIEMEKLREISWGGIPADSRPVVWQVLLGYLPLKQERREPMLKRKRQEYYDCVRQYYDIPDKERGTAEQKTLHQILVDIPRTHPSIAFFHNPSIQQSMERILYIWAIRHPASGYVQGINDLLTPFLTVFLSTYVDDPLNTDLSLIDPEYIKNIEADSYWCLTKLLDGIQDHYTFAQPGLQRMVLKMEELVHRCDADLYKHLVETEGLQFVQFAFRWMNCLLMRELPYLSIIRLWDTYLCEEKGFEKFHVYVCSAILMTFGEELKKMEFQDLVLYLQNLPTQKWEEKDIEPLLSRAFILKSYFQDAPNHLS